MYGRLRYARDYLERVEGLRYDFSKKKVDPANARVFHRLKSILVPKRPEGYGELEWESVVTATIVNNFNNSRLSKNRSDQQKAARRETRKREARVARVCSTPFCLEMCK